ncbi:MAG: hypothetical protein SD837_22050 [Candidatus Electrothrix scaldis]|nr:MAG: hypothetical protein SD837_22050 [Candidatus Electrothrix sp. GW3-3]
MFSFIKKHQSKKIKNLVPLLLFFFFLFGDFLAPAPAHAVDVFEWLGSFFQTLYDLVVWSLTTAWYLFTDPFYLIFSGFLFVVEGFFTVLDLSALGFDTVLDWSSLPDQLVWILCEIDFSQGVSLIVTATGIRMLMNLIPASLTRV